MAVVFVTTIFLLFLFGDFLVVFLIKTCVPGIVWKLLLAWLCA